jgi:16S rRNA (guanine527-N7)-methyltransferase
VKLSEMNSTKRPTVEFREALETEAINYRIKLPAEVIRSLSKYYELLNVWNSRLHLVGPCSPKEFATRHVLESLVLLDHLPEGARVADIGSGAGLPIIPCLIARPDVHAVLIEASNKKAIFLREALNETLTSGRASVIAERFENMEPPEVGFVTSRALERFEQILPQMVSWAPAPGKLLLFGGEGLGKKIEDSGFGASKTLIPMSQRRFLFVISKP